MQCLSFPGIDVRCSRTCQDQLRLAFSFLCCSACPRLVLTDTLQRLSNDKCKFFAKKKNVWQLLEVVYVGYTHILSVGSSSLSPVMLTVVSSVAKSLMQNWDACTSLIWMTWLELLCRWPAVYAIPWVVNAQSASPLYIMDSVSLACLSVVHFRWSRS